MRELIKDKKWAYIISIFCTFLWGSAFPTVKLTYRELGIQAGDTSEMILVAGIRFFLAGLLVVFIMSFLDKKNLHQLKTNFPYLLKLGLIVVTFGYLFFYVATGNTSGMKSALISSSSTFFVVIFSHYLLGEEFTKYKLIAILFGILGIIITNVDKGFDFNFTIKGEGFMLINSILGALSTIYVKKHGKGISPFASSAGQFLYGGFLLMVIGFILSNRVMDFTFLSVVLIIYAALISSVAFSLWYIILQEYKASEIAFLRLFIPFFGTFLSALVLGESLNPYIILGLILVIIGIVIINKTSDAKVRGTIIRGEDVNR
ncbi:DMT family transporter [uncultured Helcococcus sp.]|uniref:DMT family transporter n=1 Tax=uncultured Helcococcus sp. TaxID=1072508 RepID=UPI00262B3B3B|nr:DMT family transporter [uncultured Helcococcus sp.]